MSPVSTFLRRSVGRLLLLGCLPQLGISAEKTAEKAEATPAFHFTDVTASTGIRFQHAVSLEKKYLVESMSGGVLLLDYDRDGWLDIYFTNAPSVDTALRGEKAMSALYHNNHDGTFTDVTDKAGVGYPCWAMGGAVADYNNDGWPDILVTCAEGLVLYRNNGNGTFTDVTREAHLGDTRWATGAAFADYDGDGFVDLMITRYVEFDLKNLPKFGVGPTCHFRGIPVQCGPRGMKGLGDSLYHNNGDGTFTDVSKSAGVDDSAGYYGLGLTWTDFNDDGRPDLFIADDSTPNYLYRNDGNGHFTDVGFVSGTAVSEDGGEMAGMGVAVCDYNHSGRFSIHVTNFEDQNNSLYRNDGNMSFTDASYAAGIGTATVPYLGWGTGCVDLDNDGWPDLFVVNGHVYPQVDAFEAGAKYRERKLVFLNKRDGTFQDVSNLVGPALAIPQASRGAAFGDLDNDGDTDVVVENIDGAPMILHNDGGNQKHWITLQLVGSKSNRLAIGAKVKAVAGPLVQVDEVRSGGSYLSQNDLRIHFGLGDVDKVDRIEIRWSSGRIETLQNLTADRFYVVKESEGIVPPEKARPTAESGGNQFGNEFASSLAKHSHTSPLPRSAQLKGLFPGRVIWPLWESRLHRTPSRAQQNAQNRVLPHPLLHGFRSIDTIHLPAVLSFSAVAAGIKARGRLDLALAEALPNTTAAAVFTRNRLIAAQVEVGRASLAASGVRSPVGMPQWRRLPF